MGSTFPPEPQPGTPPRPSSTAGNDFSSSCSLLLHEYYTLHGADALSYVYTIPWNIIVQVTCDNLGTLIKEDMPTHVQQSKCEMKLKKLIIIRVGSNSGNGSCEKCISLKLVYNYYGYIP